MAVHAYVSPQSDCKSFTSSVQPKMTFSPRTTPTNEDLLKECEKSINDELLPKLLKKSTYTGNTGIYFRCRERRVV